MCTHMQLDSICYFSHSTIYSFIIFFISFSCSHCVSCTLHNLFQDSPIVGHLHIALLLSLKTYQFDQ